MSLANIAEIYNERGAHLARLDDQLAIAQNDLHDYQNANAELRQALSESITGAQYTAARLSGCQQANHELHERLNTARIDAAELQSRAQDAERTLAERIERGQ